MRSFKVKYIYNMLYLDYEGRWAGQAAAAAGRPAEKVAGPLAGAAVAEAASAEWPAETDSTRRRGRWSSHRKDWGNGILLRTVHLVDTSLACPARRRAAKQTGVFQPEQTRRRISRQYQTTSSPLTLITRRM